MIPITCMRLTCDSCRCSRRSCGSGRQASAAKALFAAESCVGVHNRSRVGMQVRHSPWYETQRKRQDVEFVPILQARSALQGALHPGV